MSNANVSGKPNVKPLIEKILEVLSERNGAILASRHGIGGNGRKKTLESIGQGYNITRERVRQIEEASYQKIRKSPEFEILKPALAEVADFIKTNGGISSEEHLTVALATESNRPYLALLLALGDDLISIKEGDTNRASWSVSHDHSSKAKRVLATLEKKLEKMGEPISEEALVGLIYESNTEDLPIDHSNVFSFLNVSRNLKKGPFGKWGLAHWPQISPRGVRDKVYLVLSQAGEPLHFRKLAELIDKADFGGRNTGKNTHPQTVHNELIKDNRFILIGRGIYALRDWGYVPGTVKDVIISVLQGEGAPLERDVIVERVLSQRKVQKNTILLNLQNKKNFKKMEGSRFHLA
ncbi:MAG: sigma factor-like helix-turn-helix DNA-binding protein [Candidatus Spechtbacterales bacterium]